MMRAIGPIMKKRRTLRNQNDLAVGTWRQDFFVGAGSLGERQFLADDRPQGAILHPSDQCSMNLLFFGFGDAP